MPYSFLLSDFAGTTVSELAAASAKRIAVPVSGMATSAVVVRADSDDADLLLEGDKLVRVYDVDEAAGTRTLLGHHRLITAEEAASDAGASVAAAFADPYWVLARRLVGKSAAGYSSGTALAPVDRGAIITDVVNTTNVESVSGVRMGIVTPSSSTYVAGWTYKAASEGIAELGATLDGPDWRIRPIEWTGGYYGELDVAPVIGAQNLEAAFEYGPDGLANVRGYKRAITFDGALNRAYNLPPAGGPGTAVITDQDLAAQAMRGLLEGVIAADLPSDDLRQKLVTAHIKVRAGGRQTITFEPVRDLGKRVPRFGRDFAGGDVIPFRASLRRGARIVKRVDALVRVYGVEIAVDDAGYGTPTITVTPT